MGNLIHRGKGNFTLIENTVFFDRNLSLKAKGTYCHIRSLQGNSEWIFTVKGFTALVKDGKDSVISGLRELENSRYLIRARKRESGGKFSSSGNGIWVTLDDPETYEEVVSELREEGYAIVSEFVRNR